MTRGEGDKNSDFVLCNSAPPLDKHPCGRHARHDTTWVRWRTRNRKREADGMIGEEAKRLKRNAKDDTRPRVDGTRVTGARRCKQVDNTRRQGRGVRVRVRAEKTDRQTKENKQGAQTYFSVADAVLREVTEVECDGP